jgi:hypothetical protein
MGFRWIMHNTVFCMKGMIVRQIQKVEGYIFFYKYEGVSKRFHTESIMK